MRGMTHDTKRDPEKERLIRCIRDYEPSWKAAILRNKDFAELAAIYKTLRGY